MTDETALDAILELRAVWDRRQGRVTLRDLGLVSDLTFLSRGFHVLPPEQWRGYPRSYGGKRAAAA